MTDDGPGLGRGSLIGLGLAATLVPLNSTMIAVALPDIAADLDVSKGTTGVLVTVYLVVMLIGQPVMGRLSDVVGPRRMLTVSMVGFATVSGVTALVTSFPLLVVGRSVQAAFGAALMPSSQALLRTATAPTERGRAFGLIGSFIGIGAAGGPVIGGLVTQLAGWSGVFLVNVPVVVVALALVTGVAMPAVPLPVGRRNTPSLMTVLGSGVFRTSFYLQAAATLAQYSLLLVVPLVLDARGWSSGSTGLALTGLTAGMVLMGPIGGRLGDQHGRRRPIMVGVVIGALAAIVAAVAIDGSMVLLVAAMCAFGLGTGLAIPSIMTAALEAAPEELAGSASGVLSMSRYFGSIPASILLAVLVSDNGDGATALLTVGAVAVASAVVVARALPGQLPDAEQLGSLSR